MSKAPRVGLLPLYIKLYDDLLPTYRPGMDAFAVRVADKLRAAGLEVELGAVSRVRAEVDATVADLTARGVDMLATVHLAYSPSLEAVDALARSPLPLVLLDTTPGASFGFDAASDQMTYNHGIHGVQDLACMLGRRKRGYELAVGHIDDPAFVSRAVLCARAAQMAHALKTMRVVIFGAAFRGMGDFAVEAEVLRRELGISVEWVSAEGLGQRVAKVTDAEVEAECAADRERFDCASVPEEVLRSTNRVGLAVRAIVHEAGAGAFSFNFESFDRELGTPTVPFLEASKAMARGLGYAGEADAVTAAFVDALLRGSEAVTFTEMFCADWSGGSVFMSHMGECNPNLAAGQPRLVEKPYAFGNVDNPAVAVFPLRAEGGLLLNLAPAADDQFRLIAKHTAVCETGLSANYPDVPHFWLEMGGPEDVRHFLGGYSEAGGTHHCALVLGKDLSGLIELFGRMLGLEQHWLP